MKDKRNYQVPCAESCGLALRSLVCDSYGTGIDDFDYEDLDWTVTP